MNHIENINLHSVKPKLATPQFLFLVLRYSHVAGSSSRNESSPIIGKIIFPGAWADSDNRHKCFPDSTFCVNETTGNLVRIVRFAGIDAEAIGRPVFYIGPETVPVKLLGKVIRNSSARIGNCRRKKSGFCAGIPLSLNAYERLSS